MLKPALLLTIAMAVLPLSVQSQTRNESVESLFEKAEQLFYNRERETAGELFSEIEDAVCSSAGLAEECVKTKIHLASISSSNREFESFDAYLEEAELIIKDRFNPAHPLMSHLYQSRINHYSKTGNFESGKQEMQRALDYLDETGEEDIVAARIFHAIGNLVDEIGNYSDAVYYYQKSIDAASESVNIEERLRIFSIVYNNMAFSLRRSGEIDKAMENYLMALDATEELYGENHADVGLIYNNIGTIHYLRGDYGQAADFFNRAGDLFLQSYGEEHPNVAGAYNNAAAIYLQLGDLEKGTELLERAQRIKEKTVGVRHLDTAIGYSNLAHVYREMGRFELALENLEKSLRIRQDIYGDDHPSLIEVHRMTGDYYSQTGNQKAAREQYRKADTILRDRVGKENPDRNELHYKIGISYHLEGNLDNALSYYQLALYGFTGIGITSREQFDLSEVTYPRRFLRLLESLGDITRELHMAEEYAELLPESHYYYRWAADVMQQIQTSYDSEASKLNLVEEHHAIYTRAIEVCRLLYEQSGEQRWLDELLWFSEAGRSRVALELLKKAEARAFSGVPEALIERELKMSADIARFTQQLHKEISNREQEDKERMTAYRDSLFRGRQELRDFIQELESQYPDYYELKYNRNYTTSEEASAILEDDEMLLSYSVGEREVSALIVSSQGTEFVNLGSSESLDNEIREFRESAIDSDPSQFKRLGSKLYNQLMKPVLGSVEKPSLIIIPDGPLHYLPFDMLLSEETAGTGYEKMPFLVREKSISYAPSITLLQKLRERERRQSGKLFAMAPFVDTGVRETEVLTAYRGAAFSQLPLSGFEVQQIAAILSEGEGNLPGSSSVYTGMEATPKALLNANLSEYDFIHFATHAFINEENPELSGLLLNRSDKTDGTLYVNDIYTLQMNADLVVLSACETGLGTHIRGEGIIGFTRAFLYAGASGLMVSLWRVNDQPTAELMTGFYEHVESGNDFSEALRLAKLDLIEDPEFAAPRNWAPFILQGGI